MKNEIDKSDLVLRVYVISSMLVGYGDVFTCNVAEVKKGGLPDKQVRIVVLPQHKKLYALSVSERQRLFEIGFVKNNDNEPYAIMPINGFVDSNKTSWEIVFARQENTKQ